MVKKIKLLLLLISILFCFVSCGDSSLKYVEVQKEFSQYPSEDRFAFLMDNQTLIFEDSSLDLSEALALESSDRIRGVEILDGKVYSLVESQQQDGQYRFIIYEYDLAEMTFQLRMQKEDITSSIMVESYNHLLYVQYSKNDANIIDVYDPLANEFRTIDSGEDLVLSDYIDRDDSYSVEIQKTAFEVLKKETQEKHIVDDSFLETTPFYKSLQTVDYNIENYYQYGDQLFLIYRLKTESFFEIPKGYTFVIFEYNFDNETLFLQSVLFPYDCEGYQIKYDPLKQAE